MTNAELTKKAKNLKSQMAEKRRINPKATLAELKTLIQCREKGEYEPMFETKLYTIHGGEYCEYLQLLS